MNARERIEGARATLFRLLQAERDATGRQAAWVQWADIQGEDWTEGMTQRDALWFVYEVIEDSLDLHFEGKPVTSRNDLDFLGTQLHTTRASTISTAASPKSVDIQRNASLYVLWITLIKRLIPVA